MDSLRFIQIPQDSHGIHWNLTESSGISPNTSDIQRIFQVHRFLGTRFTKTPPDCMRFMEIPKDSQICQNTNSSRIIQIQHGQRIFSKILRDLQRFIGTQVPGDSHRFLRANRVIEFQSDSLRFSEINKDSSRVLQISESLKITEIHLYPLIFPQIPGDSHRFLNI